MQLTALCKVLPPGGGNPFHNQILRIMKLTATLLLAACLQVSANGIAQVTFSGTDVPLSKVFAAIEKQTGFYVVYNEEAIKSAKPVTIEVKNESVENVLKQCLKGQPFDFTIENKTIFIVQKQGSTPQKTGSIEQDHSTLNIDVKGRIVNEKGEPVIATVSVKKTSYSVSTNDNGEFILNDIDENATLIITGIGIETFEVKVNGQTEFLLTAKTKIVSEEAVTVTVNTGYQKIPKERATGSFEHIDSKLYNREVSTDVLSRLENITNGLYVSKVAGETEYAIRGLSTLFSNRAPLIVVDNFPYHGNINNINPNDVESITILKDAAAASIWGAKAGNGVIVITTKKGEYGEPLKISVNSNVTIQMKPDIFYDRNFVQAADFINVEKFLFSQGFYNSSLSDRRRTNSPVVELLNKVRNGILSQDEADQQINLYKSLDIRNDYDKYLYRNGVAQQYSIGFSGGSNTINYFISGGYDKILTTVVGNKYDRKTLRTFLNVKPYARLEFQVGFNYNSSVSHNNSIGNIVPGGGHSILYPYAQLADDNGNSLEVIKDYNSLFKDTAGQGLLLDWKYRPLNELKLSNNKSKLQDIVAIFGVQYKIVNALNLEIKYQYENQNQEVQNYYSKETYFTRNLINLFSQRNGSSIKRNIPLGGIQSNNYSRSISNLFRSQINYSVKWSKNHHLNALAGGEINEQQILDKGYRVYGFDDNTLTFSNVDYATRYSFYGNLGSGSIPSGIVNADKVYRFTSVFANAAYNYDSRYTISASFRKDASNLFGVKTNQKGVPLWSAGLKWNLSQESFYHVSALPIVSLRLSYGYNGNVNSNLSALTTISYSSNPAITNLPYATIRSFPNEELRWERVKTWNAGVDFQLKNNFISGSIEYYIKNGIDLLTPAPVDPTLGTTQMTFNTSNTSTKGIDIKLNFKFIDTKFKWNSQIIFNYVTNKVTKYLLEFPSPFAYVNFGYSINPIEGKDPYAIIAYRFGGLDPQTGDPFGYSSGSKTKDYQTLTLNPTWEDLVTRGTTRPPYYGSLLNWFTWKGFSLSTNLTYKFGFNFRRTTIDYNSFFNAWIGNRDFEKRWQNPGDEKSTDIPSMVYPNDSNRDRFFNYSDATIEKGDFIKLQDINFSYSPRKILIGKYSITGTQFYIYASNIGIIWRANEYGIDPDYGTGIPTPFSISFGIKANF